MIIRIYTTMFRRLIAKQRRSVFGCLSVICCICFVYLYMRQQQLYFGSRLRQKVLGNLHGIKKGSVIAHQVCKLPQLPYWSQDIENYMFNVTPLNCEQEKEWIFTQNGKFYISKAAEEVHGNISCTYTPYVNERDGHKSLEPMRKFANGSQLKSDSFKVNCKGTDGAIYERFHPCIVKREKIKETTDHSKAFNVMMLGCDSLSRLMVMRLLPKTYEYFTKDLKGEVLKGYNIRGEGTTAALMPILTGTGEEDHGVAEVRRGKPGAVYVDEALTFIWKRFEKKGYVTQWGEDDPHTGAFNLRLLGFKNKPVHHYMRTFYSLAFKTFYRYKRPCYGSKARHNLLLDWLKEGLITNRGRNFFTLGFLSELSHHNNNPIRLADNDIVDFMKFMKKEGFLTNTIFFLFSDHGARVGTIRTTEQGRLEEKMPFVGLYLPDEFKRDFPNKVKDLKMNTNLLTSPFDIHETLMDVLNVNADITTSHTKNRGRSLLRRIPINRTCTDAGVSPLYCGCMQWENVSVSNDRVVKVVGKAVEWINSMLSEYAHLCHTLKLHNITRALVAPDDEPVYGKDSDDTILNGSDKLSTRNEIYQITFLTTPGMGMFETAVRYRAKTGQVITNKKDICRLDLYGLSSYCVVFENPELMKFCVCKYKSNLS